MKLRLIFILFFLVQWCIYGFAQAEETPHIAGSTIKDRMKEALQFTQHSVDVCIHDFAALDIGEDLVNAKTRGIRARVVVLNHKNNPLKGPLAASLIQKGFDVRVITLPNNDYERNPNQDFLILDDRILITGVYNWMAYRNRNANNCVTFHYDKGKAISYKNRFYKLFAEGDNAAMFISWKQPGETTILPVSHPSSIVRNNGHNTKKDSGEKTNTPDMPPKETDTYDHHKNFIDVSFEELNKLFGDESTLSRSEKKAQWEKYDGKYIRWNGTVVYKGIGRVDWNRVGISHQGDRSKADVIVLFDWKMFQKVLSISEGNTITYTGKLISRPYLNSQFRIQDGIIE